MPKIAKYYGKLPSVMLADLDALLLKLRRKNRKLLRNATIKRSEISPLPDDEFIRLWGYMRHCCSMVASWPNVSKSIAVIADKSGRDVDGVREECIDSMTVHVYTYAWRKYKHSEECGLVFSTAEFGYKAWISSQNAFHEGESAAESLFVEEKLTGGSKVNTAYCDQ